MSTNDVPGYKSKNHDELAMGCWAEHEDGSLIFVESVENQKVVYSIFDVNAKPPLEYRDAMIERSFKRTFSWPTDTGDKWTWHDKTPFPWDRIMDTFKGGTRYATAHGQVSAARRVADALKLRAEKMRSDRFEHRVSQAREGAGRVRDKIQRAIKELRS